MLFSLGDVVITYGAIRLFLRHDENYLTFLNRHVKGDWGLVDNEDAKANDDAVKNHTRILSVYDVHGNKIWIITEADRSSTTILLPDEY